MCNLEDWHLGDLVFLHSVIETAVLQTKRLDAFK